MTLWAEVENKRPVARATFNLLDVRSELEVKNKHNYPYE